MCEYIDLTEEDARLLELKGRRAKLRQTYDQLCGALRIEEKNWLDLCFMDADSASIEWTQTQITQLSACQTMFAAAVIHIDHTISDLVGFIAAVEWTNAECDCMD